MLCKSTMIWYCNASLCKKVRHYFRHYLVLFTFNSKLSFVFYYVNLPKGEGFVNWCVSTLINWCRVTHICVGNLNIIGSDNGFSPGRRQTIIWTDTGILLIGPSGADFNEISIKKSYIFIHENLFENVVRKMAAILFWPPCVNTLRPSDAILYIDPILFVMAYCLTQNSSWVFRYST